MAGKKGMKATGRPKVADPRVTITIRVAAETAQRLRTLRECGFKVGRWVDTEIGKFFPACTDEWEGVDVDKYMAEVRYGE